MMLRQLKLRPGACISLLVRRATLIERQRVAASHRWSGIIASVVAYCRYNISIREPQRCMTGIHSASNITRDCTGIAKSQRWLAARLRPAFQTPRRTGDDHRCFFVL